MIVLPNLDEEMIVDVLEAASSKNDYRFSFEELGTVLRYTIRKATGRYSVDPKMFSILLENELHDYVMRKGFNDKKEREAKRCVNFAIPTRT